MSELKDYSILDIEAIDDERHKTESAPGKWVPESRVYLKSEADKVIAELEERYFELQDTAIKIDKELTETRKQLRHQKYKRSLAMMRWCDAMKSYFNESGFFDVYSNERMVFYERWHNRWFKIAEQFKEEK